MNQPISKKRGHTKVLAGELGGDMLLMRCQTMSCIGGVCGVEFPSVVSMEFSFHFLLFVPSMFMVYYHSGSTKRQVCFGDVTFLSVYS